MLKTLGDLIAYEGIEKRLDALENGGTGARRNDMEQLFSEEWDGGSPYRNRPN